MSSEREDPNETVYVTFTRHYAHSKGLAFQTKNELFDAQLQAAKAEARQELAEQIVSNSTHNSGSLKGGNDTFTIDKQTLWQLTTPKEDKETE